MNSDFSKFLIKTIAATAVLAIAGFLAFTFLFPDKYLPVLPWMLVFFALVTLITYYAQLRVAQKDFGRFTRNSMLVSFLRLVIYSVFAFIYLSQKNDRAAVFVVCLAVTYLVFTFLEVSDLSRVAKQNRIQSK